MSYLPLVSLTSSVHVVTFHLFHFSCPLFFLPKQSSLASSTWLSMACLHLLILVLFQPLVHQLSARTWCMPHQNCWPTQQVWMAFSNSLNGSLLKPHPSAFYCHYPNYNSQLCQITASNWTNAFWRSDQVGSMQYPNWEAFDDQTCLINSNPNIPCYQGAVPIYAVNVADIQDVQESLKFAAKYNIRLVVKNTGHDFLGRSSAPGSLSIWLHNLKRIRFDESFVADGHCGRQQGVAALTAEAGVQWRELYEVADENGVVVVGSQGSSVGVAGGYVQGGGHSALSRYYGLAADNVLQFTLVTPDGKIRIANMCQNQELFWALRGGGGGTFGVVMLVTFRAFHALQNVIGASYLIISSNSSQIQNFVYHFTSITPQLADFGWSGYFTIGLSYFYLQYLVPNMNLSSAQASLAPLLEYVNAHPQLNLTYSSFSSYPSFRAWHTFAQCSINPGVCTDRTGSNVILASRLIPRTTIVEKPATLTQIFMDGLRNGSNSVNGHLVAGGNVTEYRNDAVNPPWRKALWELSFSIVFPQNSSGTQTRAYIEKVSSINAPLRNLTPESGAYLNEADYNEPNWQQSFFGRNYPRLLRIKKKVDPLALLICHFCVGSEDDLFRLCEDHHKYYIDQ